MTTLRQRSQPAHGKRVRDAPRPRQRADRADETQQSADTQRTRAEQRSTDTQHPPEQRSRPSRDASAVGTALAYTLAFVVLGGYLVWLCLAMSAHSPVGGVSLILGIAAAAMAGLIAMILGLLLGHRRR